MNCKVCDTKVNHYNSIFFPERMNADANYPCFPLCFFCADEISTFFVQRRYLQERELYGKMGTRTQKNVALYKSGLAQRKRVGPITQRSSDRNWHSLHIFFLYLYSSLPFFVCAINSFKFYHDFFFVWAFAQDSKRGLVYVVQTFFSVTRTHISHFIYITVFLCIHWTQTSWSINKLNN